MSILIVFISSSIQEAVAAIADNKRSPADFLKAVLGRPVNVRLNTGTDYRGTLHLIPLCSLCSYRSLTHHVLLQTTAHTKVS
jgi:hypothetical protein